MNDHRIILVLAAAMLAVPAIAQTPAGNAGVSTDGRWRAFIKPERGESGASGEVASSLWLADRRTGVQQRLFRGVPSANPHRATSSIARPVFSLDGGYIYVEADAYATSPAIHQIDRRTGRERFVADGGLVGVLRNGPWRGYLVVQQHRYRNGGGSYDPMIVVRPDGHVAGPVPGTDGHDADGALAAWLRRNGWRLS